MAGHDRQPEPEQQQKRGRRGRRDLLILGGLAVVLAGLLIAVIVGRTGNGESGTAAPGSNGAAASSSPKKLGPLGDLSRRTEGDPRALGDVDAPVTMVVFSDFRCPFCAEYTREIEPDLVDKYVDNGLLRIEWRDQPMFGAQSELAARAGWAAAAQGRFWQFVDHVHGAAPATGHPDLPIDALVEHAKAAGVGDLERFRREALDGTYDDDVAEDLKPSQQYGIIGVPAFVIDGEPIVGVRPLSTFETVIDEYLAAG